VPAVGDQPEGKAFLPIHAEGRVTYYFGKGALSRSGLRPFVHLSGGVAQVDADVLVKVYANREAFDRGDVTSLHAWKKSGTSFVALGGGLMFAFTPKQGVYLDARFMQLFPESGSVFSPQLGYSVGL